MLSLYKQMPTNMAEYSTVTTTIVRTVVFCPTFILHYRTLHSLHTFVYASKISHK